MKYALVNTANNKQMGSVWLEGDTVKAEPDWLQQQIGTIMVAGKTQADGEDFMKVLPFHYRSGYSRLVKTE